MGMVMCARRLSNEELARVHAEPDSAIEIIEPELDSNEDEFVEDDRLLDVDKSWHGIHFLLTGTAWSWSEPAGAAILGGEPIGPDNGYGPARLMPAEHVREVHAGLVALDRGTLAARYDADTLRAAEIYPEIWVGEDALDYLLENYDQLRRFYAAAAADNEAVLLAIM